MSAFRSCVDFARSTQRLPNPGNRHQKRTSRISSFSPTRENAPLSPLGALQSRPGLARVLVSRCQSNRLRWAVPWGQCAPLRRATPGTRHAGAVARRPGQCPAANSQDARPQLQDEKRLCAVRSISCRRCRGTATQEHSAPLQPLFIGSAFIRSASVAECYGNWSSVFEKNIDCCMPLDNLSGDPEQEDHRGWHSRRPDH